MMRIAFDSHKRYTLASVESADGEIIEETRIPHRRGDISGFLETFDEGTPGST